MHSAGIKKCIQTCCGGYSASMLARIPWIGRFSRCNSGATAIEYGLICSLIFLVIVAGVKGVATQTTIMHTTIQNATQ